MVPNPLAATAPKRQPGEVVRRLAPYIRNAEGLTAPLRIMAMTGKTIGRLKFCPAILLLMGFLGLVTDAESASSPPIPPSRWNAEVLLWESVANGAVYLKPGVEYKFSIAPAGFDCKISISGTL